MSMQVPDIPANVNEFAVLLGLQILTAITMSNVAAVINIIASLIIIILNAYRLAKESGKIKPKQKTENSERITEKNNENTDA